MSRGRYFSIPQAVEAYPGVLAERLIRRLVQQRRIAFTYCGRRIILAETDIEAYLDANRREPAFTPMSKRLARGARGRSHSTTAPSDAPYR